MTGQKISSDKIKTEALRLGFSVCGIAKAEAVDEATARHYRQWIESGRQAEMHYMENHLDKRLDPRLLMDGLKTIVCVALNYCPAQRLPDGEYQIADYALGKDYHDIVKQKLHQLAQTILSPLNSYRVFSDSAPILERYWAVKAGLGWIGRNHQLIITPSSPNTQLSSAGSKFFLGELFLNIEADYYEKEEDEK